MRHVSRTHRVSLDWLFDRIILDPEIQVKYIDTKNQLADVLTKGHFTRDEWTYLLLFDRHQPFQLSQNVCELMFGVNVPDLNFGIQNDSVGQPVVRNSVGS